MTRLIVIAGPEEEGDKKFIIADGDTIGNDPSDSISLKSDQLSPGYIKLKLNDQGVSLATCSPDITIEVNGESMQQGQIFHGDLITFADYTFMLDEGREAASHVSEEMESRIESRQAYYDDAIHVLESLKDGEKSQGRLITLYKIANAISGILDLDHLLKRLLEILLEEFSADRGFIMLVAGAEKRLEPAAVISKKMGGDSPKISKKIVEEVITNKKSILCENVLNDTRFKARESLVRNNVVSAMCVPLIRKGETLGLMLLDSEQHNKFVRNDLDLLTKVAMQASIVIENARYYKVRQEFNRNLLALSQATQAISSYLREDLIIQDSVQYASQIFQAQKSYLFLKEIEEKEEELNLVKAVGIPREKWPEIEIPASLKEAVAKNNSFIFNNQNSIPEDLSILSDNGNSIMAVPIPMSSDVKFTQPGIGVICVAEKENGEEFTQGDKQLLTILASHTATSLSNAKFYQQLKKKEEEIARWNLQLEKRVSERTAELKSTQGQLIQSEKMAAVGLLAAGVAHEFNNIIASMYGFAQIAKKDPKYRDKLVDTVISQSKRGCDITENLLSFSKQRGERLELVDVRDLIESVLRLTMSALENEGIQICKNFKDIPKTMLNPSKIQQVFLNLIINARHAIEKNGTITINIHTESNNIYVSFEDTGSGINSKNLQRIFEPFYTTKGSFGGGTQPGTGIGLSLCYNIIKQHNGEIEVTSEQGIGSKFIVSLPISTKAPMAESRETGKFIAKQNFGKRILIVEDIEEIRSILSNVLEEKGYDIYIVDNGSQAIEMCKKERFDTIFLDIRMPGLKDGFDVFDEVKRLEPYTKVIIITGRAEDTTLLRYVGQADGYLRKPFAVEDIYHVLGLT